MPSPRTRKNNRYSQQKVFDFIVQYKQEHDGCSPSYRTIMAELNIPSLSTVKRLLERLREFNLISFLPEHHGIMVHGGEWRMNAPLEHKENPVVD